MQRRRDTVSCRLCICQPVLRGAQRINRGRLRRKARCQLGPYLDRTLRIAALGVEPRYPVIGPELIGEAFESRAPQLLGFRRPLKSSESLGRLYDGTPRTREGLSHFLGPPQGLRPIRLAARDDDGPIGGPLILRE